MEEDDQWLGTVMLVRVLTVSKAANCEELTRVPIS
jgi:hypothetical protein